MAWRMLMRRCPARSMTVVGDMAQASDLGGRLVLAGGPRAAPGRPVAAGAADHQLPHPRRDRRRRGRRAGGDRPGASPAAPGPGNRGCALVAAGDGRRAARRARSAGRIGGQPDRGQSAGGHRPGLAPGRADGGGRGRGAGRDQRGGPDLDRPVVVLSVTQAKGLEFDAVLVADPRAHRGRFTPRAERPLRGDHPGNPAARRGA